MLKKLVLPAFIFGVFFAHSQVKDSTKTRSKGQWYGSWGYTRAWYSKSDIHLQNYTGPRYTVKGRINHYDFTVYDAKASDRPDFDAIPDVANITIPQFVFRVGYYFNKNTGIELNYDHTKYVVNSYQKVRVKGQIDGVALDKDTILDPTTFLHFEHSDGANFWMLNFVKRFALVEKGNKFHLYAVAKPGAGVVFPRTDVTLFGENVNNDWKVAGYIGGFETGIRAEFGKYCLFEFVTKGAYANYVNAFVVGKGNGKASHHFFAGQCTATIGFIIPQK